MVVINTNIKITFMNEEQNDLFDQVNKPNLINTYIGLLSMETNKNLFGIHTKGAQGKELTWAHAHICLGPRIPGIGPKLPRMSRIGENENFLL